MIIMLPFLCLMVVLLIAFHRFDRLVKIEYEKYRNEWIADRKPRGFFWRPSESPLVSGSFAMQVLSMKWLFRTPAWAVEDSEAKERLKELRLYVLIFNIGIIIWAVFGVMRNG